MMLNALLHAQDWDSARRKRWERVFINRQFLRNTVVEPPSLL